MMTPTSAYMREMAERTDAPRTHRVHRLSDRRPCGVSQDVLDAQADEKYFGSTYRKVPVCKCGLRHNGECY
jgi:hypothetical protein